MTRYRLSSCLAAVAAAALAVAVPATPARAHTELTGTSPAAGSTATEAVTAVTLTFSGLVKMAGATVAVTGPDKTSYSQGAPEAVDKTVTQQVSPLPLGTIRVVWQVVAADGHPIQGSFTFTNEAVPPTPTAAPTTVAPAIDPAPAGTSAAAAPQPAGRASERDASAGLWWAVGGAVVLVLALLGGLFWRRRRLTV